MKFLNNASTLFALGLSLAFPPSSSAEFPANAFAHCDWFEGYLVVNGIAYGYENVDRGTTKTIKIGTYTVVNERISNIEFGGKGGHTYTKAYKVRRNDGTLEGLLLPLDMRQAICK